MKQRVCHEWVHYFVFCIKDSIDQSWTRLDMFNRNEYTTVGFIASREDKTRGTDDYCEHPC